MDYKVGIYIESFSKGTGAMEATKDIQKLDNAAKKTSSGGLGKLAKTLESTGSRVNVLGQRMTGMITLPLLMFANKSIDTAISVEKSWVRFNKVFSGTEEQVASLTKTGTELSEKFGVNVEDVAEVMGEFNKAGIESEDALKALTEQALETSILFDTDLSGAFDGVKALMFGFGMDAKETTDALAAINIVADHTTTSEQDILDVFERSGAIFRLHNIGVTEAAALTSLLAQSNIKGTKAGTAFKTILAKICDATPETAKGIAAFGIDINGTAFRTSTFTDKLRLLNKTQTEVFSSGNKSKIADWNTVLKDLTGIRQGDKFSILVSKIGDLDGVIENASDSVKNLKVWNEQLATVMESSPHKFEIMNQIYRNQAAIIGKELLPYKMELLKFMTKLIDKFNKLSPSTKDWVLKLGLIVAVLGPVLAFAGLMITAIGFMLTPVGLFIIGMIGFAVLLSVAWAKNWGGIQEKTKFVIDKLKEYYNNYLVPFFDNIKKKLKDLKLFWDDYWGKLSGTFQAWLDTMTLIFKTWWSAFSGGFKVVAAIFRDGDWSKAWDEMTKIFETFGTNMPKIWGGLWETLSSILGTNVSSMEEALDGLFGKILKYEAKMAGKGFLKGLAGPLGVFLADGGIVQAFNNGGMVYAASGYLAKGKDTVPAMLSPGEMVLNKSQQSNLFNMLSGRAQMQTAGGPIVNINVGTMVASRGEQREFARKIKELIGENNYRQ